MTLSSDTAAFIAGIVFFGLYLLWSAATEMGTRWPRQK